MKGKRILLWSLVALWMGLIFFFSAQPAEISSEQSGGFIRLLLLKFCPNFEHLTPIEQFGRIEYWQHIVRKIAHFCIYGCLGMLCLGALYQHKMKFWNRPIAAVLISCAYAISDEVHQRFVPGRSCELRDICIDTVGAVVAVLVLMLLIQTVSKIRNKSVG